MDKRKKLHKQEPENNIGWLAQPKEFKRLVWRESEKLETLEEQEELESLDDQEKAEKSEKSGGPRRSNKNWMI